MQAPITPTPVELHLPIYDAGDVSPVTQELHDLLPFPGELCPAGGRLRVLLQPSQPLPVKLEVNLAELGSAGPPDRIAPACEFDRHGLRDQGPAPHGNQSFLHARGHRYPFPRGLPKTPSILSLIRSAN